MRKLVILTFLLGLFCSGYTQTIEDASVFYEKDSLSSALNIINGLDQNDINVIKLKRKVEKRQVQIQNEKQKQLKMENIRKKNEEHNYTRIYGGIPTANENMKWNDNLTPNEKYIGVIYVDSSYKSSQIISAFIATYQPIQDANIMTKQMRTNNAIGSYSSVLSGDMNSLQDFAKAGNANNRMQNQGQDSWTIQFIDGVQLNRFYYNINVQAKDGRYKITVVPSGLSGYGQDHIQTPWSQMFKDGKIKPIYSNYYEEMKTKLAYTIDIWINQVEKHLIENVKQEW